MMLLPDGLANLPLQVASEVQELVALQRPRPLTPLHSLPTHLEGKRGGR